MVRLVRWTFCSGVALAALGFAWGARLADAARPYVPRIDQPAYLARRPLIHIDDAHYNRHPSWSGLQPLAALLRRDGYVVRNSTVRASAAQPRALQLMVIATPAGGAGMVQPLLSAIGADAWRPWLPSPFTRWEVAALEAWVRGGGSLLLAGGSRPASSGLSEIGAAFGINGWSDAGPAANIAPSPTWLSVSAENAGLGEHPILSGRNGAERVTRVLAANGQRLRAGARGVALLMTPGDRRGDGGALAIAVEHGHGRVVAVANVETITAGVAFDAAGRATPTGIGRRDSDNERFAINIAHWLTRLF